jgi:glycosyltransferase involved in cell wall biosynthesis
MSIAVRVHRWFRTIDFYRRAVATVRDVRPALIHCNDYNTMWVGVAARLMGGITVVYDSHELWADRNLRPEPRWWLLACEFLFVRCAHRTITASPGYAEIMARRYRIPPPQVIRNIPADVPEEGSGAGDVTARPADPSPADGEPVAVYVGALTSGRGLELSIRALARVPGARLRLVGPSHDHYRAELGELARREGVADRVELAAAVPPERLLDAIRDASVGLVLIQPVCLSYRMSLPNKLFEYVAAGVPVLGSDLPSIGRLIEEHQIGLVAQPDQVGDIAAKLSEMLQPRRNDEFRLAVRAAADRLRWSSESRLLADTYIQAAARAHDPAPA